MNEAKNLYDDALDILVNNPTPTSPLRAFFGFDGYIDTIKKAVKYRQKDGTRLFFQTIGEFGNHLALQAGKSADFEVISSYRKIGGNAPIMACAAASLGISSACCGAMGYPDLDQVFSKPISGLRMLSIADAASTDAFEFDDGKLMFGETGSLRDVQWEFVQERLSEKGLDLVEELAASNLIAVLNWASLEHISTLIMGIKTELRERCGTEVFDSKTLFIDLADISAVDPTTVKNWMALIESVTCKTVISLNFKEAQLLSYILTGKREEDAEVLCKHLGGALSITMIIIHDRAASYAFDSAGIHTVPGFFVQKPFLSTGGGDNFNAGFAYGLLSNMKMDQCLLLGNAVSSLYVRSGISPSISDVIALLKTRDKNVLSLKE